MLFPPRISCALAAFNVTGLDDVLKRQNALTLSASVTPSSGLDDYGRGYAPHARAPGWGSDGQCERALALCDCADDREQQRDAR